MSHFLLQRCHFPTVVLTVKYHRKRYCSGARPLVLVGRENSDVYRCCLSVCLFTGVHSCHKHAANTSLKWLLCIPSACGLLHLLDFRFWLIKESQTFKCHPPSEVCVDLLTDICAAFVAPWPQHGVAFLFIEVVFNPATLPEATGRSTIAPHWVYRYPHLLWAKASFSNLHQ